MGGKSPSGAEPAAAVLLALRLHSLDQVLSQAVSAFATIGPSTGITAQFDTAGPGPADPGHLAGAAQSVRRYELFKERSPF